MINILQSSWAYFKANSHRNFCLDSAKRRSWYKKVIKFQSKTVDLILIKKKRKIFKMLSFL